MCAQLVSSDLNPLASVPQGLDGQYVPENLLKKKQPLNELLGALEKFVRAEYFRSLLYSPQVVVNRAYFINSPAIFKDFIKGSDHRDTFLRFLENKWIIPWLFKERDFKDKPAFSVNQVGWEATQDLLGEADIPYSRFSWDEKENIEKANRLSRVFTGYVMRLPLVSDRLADSLGISDENERKSFSRKMTEVVKYSCDVFDDKKRKFITRDELYLKFICVDGTQAVDGYYDFNKEFCRELKLLFDLKYNVNLPDGLGIQTLTGKDLPDRAALHEIDLVLATGDFKGVELDLATLFGKILINKMNTATWINSINHLTLEDIDKARTTPEFGDFMKASADLKHLAEEATKTKAATPIDFERYFYVFNEYQRAIANNAAQRFRVEIQPAIEIIINIGGVILTLLPESKVVKLLGTIAGLKEKVAALTAKVIATGRRGLDLHNASISRDILKISLLDPKGQASQLLEMIKKSGYKLEEYKDAKAEEKGTLEKPRDYYELEDYQ